MCVCAHGYRADGKASARTPAQRDEDVGGLQTAGRGCTVEPSAQEVGSTSSPKREALGFPDDLTGPSFVLVLDYQKPNRQDPYMTRRRAW